MKHDKIENTALIKVQRFDLEKWKKKRKWTTYIFYAFATLLGLEYSAVVLSLMFYLKDTIKVDHAPRYYSIGMTAMCSSAILSSVTLGRFIDKSRNVRGFMLTVNAVNVIGNVIYSLNFSPYLPICGRFLCGVSDSMKSILKTRKSSLSLQKAMSRKFPWML